MNVKLCFVAFYFPFHSLQPTLNYEIVSTEQSKVDAYENSSPSLCRSKIAASRLAQNSLFILN